MRKRLLTAVLIPLFALPIAGCGDDDSVSSDADPQEVLDTALGGEGEIESGVLDLSLDVNAGDLGSVTASLAGPFQSGPEETSLPQLDFTASADLDSPQESFDFQGGLTLTGDSAYITYNDTPYQLDDATFETLAGAYEQSSQLQEAEAEESGSLSALGIDPRTWLSELSNEGTEDIDGDEVVHVTGAADVSKILADLGSVAEETGQLSPADARGLEQLEQAVTGATIDVYANTEDETLRQLDIGLDIDDPTSEENVTVDLSIGIAEPNSDQEISAPEDAQPLDDLLSQIPGGAAALGGLGGVGSAGGGSGAVPADAYYDCVTQAQTPAELEECAAALAP